MDTFLTGLLYIAMLAVVGVLIFGIVNLYRTGDQARSRSNKLMRLRVVLQFGAVVLVLAIFLLREHLAG